MERMEAQRVEFDAMASLAEQYRRLTHTPIVDDDYPEVRYQYESALLEFIKSMKQNGRFGPANRYGLQEL